MGYETFLTENYLYSAKHIKQNTSVKFFVSEAGSKLRVVMWLLV